MNKKPTGQTVAEIIHQRADSSKANMGLTNWRGEKVRKTAVSIAKNYLNASDFDKFTKQIGSYKKQIHKRGLK